MKNENQNTFLLIQNFLCSVFPPEINEVVNVFFVTLSIG